MSVSAPGSLRSSPPSSRRGSVASAAPLVMGVVSVAISLALAIVTATTSTVVPLFGLNFPLAATDTIALSVAGYVLTPLVTMAALAWDKVAQRRGLQRDRNFALRPRYEVLLRWLTLGAFVVAIWHVLNIADAIAGS